MIPSHDLIVRSGNGWTIVETAGIQQTPGAHDIGAPLGIAEGTMVLVILRAAERWAPGRDTITDVTAILRQEGRMLVELADGSTQPLDAERDWSRTADSSLAGLLDDSTRCGGQARGLTRRLGPPSERSDRPFDIGRLLDRCLAVPAGTCRALDDDRMDVDEFVNPLARELSAIAGLPDASEW